MRFGIVYAKQKKQKNGEENIQIRFTIRDEGLLFA